MKIAIVGAGFTGTALAIALLDRAPAGTTLVLIEPRGVYGRGLAYSTDDPRHLLNVAAGRMSVRADQPDHLTRWLARQPAASAAPYDADSFIPRELYGRYLGESLDRAEATACAGLRRVPDEVVDVDRLGSGFRLRLRQGGALSADAVAICTGHPRSLAGTGRPSGGTIWTDDAASIGRDDRVLLVGTGLTMVDRVLTLVGRGHRGPITAVSRRGRLHLPHLPQRAQPVSVSVAEARPRLLPLLRAVRSAVRAAQSRGCDWRAVLDGLRPHIQRVWNGLSTEEKRRAIRHLRPYWDTHRHRMAPQVAAEIAALIATERLEVLAARYESIERGEAGLVVRYRRRGRRVTTVRSFDHVMDCAGVDLDVTRERGTLPASLVDGGLAAPGPLGLGLDVDPAGRCFNAAGRVEHGLFALGPLARGVLWEITAVGEIRQQCLEAAHALLAARAERHAGAVIEAAPAPL
ncbi:FAD/NAD(P)-binding protein [Acuticoccus sediminis]|nr:FAD/NAD(P)-binding protein [Acuticoccus sediminis]